MKINLTLLVSLILHSNAYANIEDEGPFDKQGFSGEISLLTGISGGKSNFNIEKKIKNGELNSAGESDSEFIAMPLGQMTYTFGKQKVFLGTAREDIVEGVLAFELGYAFAIGEESALSFSYLPAIASDETWKDPYLINSTRKKTDVSGNAYRVQYQNILNVGIDADFAYYDKDIDDELSGSSLTSNQELLKRSGDGYIFKLSAGLPLSQSTFITPSLGYSQFSADGDAMSFDQYNMGLTLMHSIGNHTFTLNGDYSKADYDAENPIFGKTQENTSYGFNLMYEYSNFMGWKNVGFNVVAGYEDTDSNINFYDEESYMLGMGMTYLF